MSQTLPAYFRMETSVADYRLAPQLAAVAISTAQEYAEWPGVTWNGISIFEDGMTLTGQADKWHPCWRWFQAR